MLFTGLSWERLQLQGWNCSIAAAVLHVPLSISIDDFIPTAHYGIIIAASFVRWIWAWFWAAGFWERKIHYIRLSCWEYYIGACSTEFSSKSHSQAECIKFCQRRSSNSYHTIHLFFAGLQKWWHCCSIRWGGIRLDTSSRTNKVRSTVFSSGGHALRKFNWGSRFDPISSEDVPFSSVHFDLSEDVLTQVLEISRLCFYVFEERNEDICMWICTSKLLAFFSKLICDRYFLLSFKLSCWILSY